MKKGTFILSPHFVFSSLGKEKNHIQGKVSDNVRTSQRLYSQLHPEKYVLKGQNMANEKKEVPQRYDSLLTQACWREDLNSEAFPIIAYSKVS